MPKQKKIMARGQPWRTLFDQHSRGEEELRWFAIQRSKQPGHTWAPVHDGIKHEGTGEAVERILHVQLDDGQILKT